MGKGYYYEADRDRWHAQLRVGGRIRNLGRFRSEAGAEAAVDAALKEQAELEEQISRMDDESPQP
jgi:hypothetical protein